MIRVKKTSVRRKTRSDQIILLRQEYVGDIWKSPAVYNKAYADVLRQMADAIQKVKNAWVDPELIVWLHQPGKIGAEVMLSANE
jgi:hypothetical protein